MRNLNIYLLFLGCLWIFSCDEAPIETGCKINIANSSITVTANVSGEEGTQITPDVIETSSITNNSAEISFIVHKVGRCHEVIDYGHVWSKEYATPTKENGCQSNYGSNVNFGDEVGTLMSDLIANRKYFVRGYVTVRSLEDFSLKTLYNNNISTFTTLRECNDGETQIDDTDRQIVIGYDNTSNPILSFEVVKEKRRTCVNGAFEYHDSTSYENHVYIKNNTSKIISCNYSIEDTDNIVIYHGDGSSTVQVYTWIYSGVLSDLSPNATLKVYLNNSYKDISEAPLEVSITNITYK